MAFRLNERKRESDEPDAPLLVKGEDVAGELDVVISKQDAGEGLHGRRAVEHESEHHHRKATPWTPGAVHPHQARQVGEVLRAVIDWLAEAAVMRQPTWLFDARVKAVSSALCAAGMNGRPIERL